MRKIFICKKLAYKIKKVEIIRLIRKIDKDLIFIRLISISMNFGNKLIILNFIFS